VVKVRLVLVMLVVLFVPEWSYAPIRIVPDEINDDKIYISGVSVRKYVVTESKNYILFTLKKEKNVYGLGFSVYDFSGEKICSLNGNVYDRERYGNCARYGVKVNLLNYETRIGKKTYLSIDLYDRYRNAVASKKVLVGGSSN
jgi:hypothetical protein